MYKTIGSLATCMFIVMTLSHLSFSQVPSLENAVSVPAGVTCATSDGYGQHLVGVFGGAVKHFLVGNDGAVIYQDRLNVPGGEYPVVTSYGGKVRVAMKVGNNLALYQSTDGGANWGSLISQNFGVSVFDIDAYSDGFGTHIVWATGSTLGNNEVYYVMLNYQSPPSFGNPKNVTDLPAQEYGYRPKISNSTSEAHVQFIAPNQQMFSRDLSLPNNWENSYTVSSLPSASSTSSTTIGTTIWCLIAQWPFYNGSQQVQYFYLTSREASSSSWSSPQYVANTVAGVGNGYMRRTITSTPTKFYVATTCNHPAGCSDQVGITLRTYLSNGTLENTESLYSGTTDANSVFLSSGMVGAYTYWPSSMRRKPIAISSIILERMFLTGKNWVVGTDGFIQNGFTVTALTTPMSISETILLDNAVLDV